MDNGINEVNINRVFLMLGSKCNFKCRYCIQECVNEIENTKISDDVYKYLYHLKAIRPRKYGKIQITFFGGEPLMYLDTIKSFVEKCKDDFDYCVVTNGKLITNDLVDYFNEHNFQVNLSNDGINTEKTRNVNLLEDSKFTSMVKKINNLCIDSVESAYSYDIKSIRDYINSKVGNVEIAREMLRVSWNMPKDIYDFDLSSYKQKTLESANRAYVDILHSNMSDDVIYFLPVLNKIAKGLYELDKPNCGQVINVMNIDLQGNVYVCHNSNIKIGNVNNTRQELLDNYTKWFKNSFSQKCFECAYLPLCKGGCPLELHTENGDKYMCDVLKIYYSIAIELANKLNNYLEQVELEV